MIVSITEFSGALRPLRKLEFIHIRIGAPREILIQSYLNQTEHKEPAGSGLANFKRDLGAYISQRDLTQLFVNSIETENINNENDIPYQIVYGCSDNTRRFWSLESARKGIGYNPEDDSEYKFSEVIDVFRNDPKWEGRLG